MFGLGKVRGRLKVTRGVITIADPPEDSRVEAEVSASSFSTRNLMRDPQVRSRFSGPIAPSTAMRTASR
jgi:polyisoprenoid-binding protein YceI